MMTKEEFEQQWNDSKYKIREIYIGKATGILATSYINLSGNSKVGFLKLLYDDYQVAIVYLGDVVKVE